MTSLSIAKFSDESWTILPPYASFEFGPFTQSSNKSYNTVYVESLTVAPPTVAVKSVEKKSNQPITIGIPAGYMSSPTIPPVITSYPSTFDIRFETKRSNVGNNYAWKKIVVEIDNKQGFDQDPVYSSTSSIPLSNPACSLPRILVTSDASNVFTTVDYVNNVTVTRSGSRYTYTITLTNTALGTNIVQGNLTLRFLSYIDGSYPVTETLALFDVVTVTGELEYLGPIIVPKLVGVRVFDSYYPNDTFRALSKLYTDTTPIVNIVRDSLLYFNASTTITTDTKFNTDPSWLDSIVELVNEIDNPRSLVSFINNELLQDFKSNTISMTIYPKNMNFPYKVSLVEQKVSVIPRTNRTTTTTLTTELKSNTNNPIASYPSTNDLSALTLTKKIVENNTETKSYSTNNRTYTINYVDTNPNVFRKFSSTDISSSLLIPGYISKDYVLIPSNRVKLDITINNVTTVATQQVGGISSLSTIITPIINI